MHSVITINIISNFLSRIWLALISLISIPYIITHLGANAYAVLSLSLVIVGYFALLDLGLGRGIVKFIAEYNAIDEKEKIRKLIGTSIVFYGIMGFIGAIILAALTNLLTTKVLKIPIELQDTSKIVFYLTSLALLFRIPQILFTSISTGYQKIHFLNIVNVIVSTLKILITVSLLYLGFFLVSIVIANLCLGIVQLVCLIWLSKKLLPHKAFYPRFDIHIAKQIFRFSLNAFIADFMGVIIVHLDKFLIGVFLPIANMAYYTVAFELASRIWEVPTNITSAAYPAFSEAHANGEKDRMVQLYIKISKFIMIGTAYIAIIIILFAKEILTYWINEDFATKGATTLRILGVGVLISSSAWAALTVANGVGRPDIPAKVHLIMAPLNVILCLILIPRYGINGAAMAWLLQHMLDIFLMIPWVNKSITGIRSWDYFFKCYLKPLGLSLLVGLAVFIMTKSYITNLITLFVVIGVGGLLYYLVSYFIALNREERSQIKLFLTRRVANA